MDEDLILTDEQLAVLAAFEDDGSEAWYRAPCFKRLLEDGAHEFTLMRALAEECVAARARIKVLVRLVHNAGIAAVHDTGCPSVKTLPRESLAPYGGFGTTGGGYSWRSGVCTCGAEEAMAPTKEATP